MVEFCADVRFHLVSNDNRMCVNCKIQPFRRRENSSRILRLLIRVDSWHSRRCMKSLTREQLQTRKEQAVRFTQNVLGDSDRADEIADESLEDYAERRTIQLTNPR